MRLKKKDKCVALSQDKSKKFIMQAQLERLFSQKTVQGSRKVKIDYQD